MPQVHLTELTLRNLKIPAQGQVTYWDRTLPTFGLRVSSRGTKAWTVMYGAERKRVTIGRHPVVGLSMARERAKELLAEVTLGRTAAPSIKFADLIALFLGAAKLKNRQRTVDDYQRLLNKHFKDKLGKKEVAEIRAQDVSGIIDKLSKTPSEANHAMTAVKAALSFAVRRHYLDHSPCSRLPLPSRRPSRNRVLDDRELVAVYNAAGKAESPFGRIVQLAILTGQRRGEIARWRHEYWDADSRTIILPATVAKNNQDHTFPVGKVAASIIVALQTREGYFFPAGDGKGDIFNGWSKEKARLDKAAPIPHWTLHDLRRTFSTGHARLGTPPHVVERLLAHTAGVVSGVAAVYNKYTYMTEMRAAIDAWEDHIAKLPKI